jgi:hypothetical protein
VSFVLEPDGLAAIARVRGLREGEHDFGHLCVSPRFPPGATVSQGLYLSECSSAKEYVPTTDAGVGYPEAGELVRILPSRNPYGDERAPFAVAKTERACDPSLVGFITDPVRGGADGHKRNEHYLPLAIYGYFPARVTLENGPIRRGDPITSSSTPGRGMKAVGACRIIGYALEDADDARTVMVFAHLGEHATAEVHALRARIRALEGRAEATHVELQELRAQLQELRTMKAAGRRR